MPREAVYIFARVSTRYHLHRIIRTLVSQRYLRSIDTANLWPIIAAWQQVLLRYEIAFSRDLDYGGSSESHS